MSDTALMVAACRAMETVRTDGLVNDPFAARLAGGRGMAIAQALPILEVMYAVTDLGAGLDTRPWRLALPEELRWMEVDFPRCSNTRQECWWTSSRSAGGSNWRRTSPARGSGGGWVPERDVALADGHHVGRVRSADGEQILRVLRRCGWSAYRRRSYLTDAWALAPDRIQAMARMRALTPQPMAALPGDDPSGVTLFARADAENAPVPK